MPLVLDASEHGCAMGCAKSSRTTTSESGCRQPERRSREQGGESSIAAFDDRIHILADKGSEREPVCGADRLGRLPSSRAHRCRQQYSITAHLTANAF
ncbi:unnamed protein product [Leptosia nina]|uniref:Uncharacterized protein n=1 Tax=Leptosia nina TaxID=320188 RepID=A0AAV1JS95_9NEOP